MLLLGSKAPNRNVEQHDFFFGIATALNELVPLIKEFWPEAGSSIHIDGWREVNMVDGYQVNVMLNKASDTPSLKKIFFINLGGYQYNKLEEQHYTMLTVQDDQAQAVKKAKETVFFTAKNIKGTHSHIDDKYGIDVDDIYKIEDVLTPVQKEKYHIEINKSYGDMPEDEIHLGYFKLDKI